MNVQGSSLSNHAEGVRKTSKTVKKKVFFVQRFKLSGLRKFPEPVPCNTLLYTRVPSHHTHSVRLDCVAEGMAIIFVIMPLSSGKGIELLRSNAHSRAGLPISPHCAWPENLKGYMRRVLHLHVAFLRLPKTTLTTQLSNDKIRILVNPSKALFACAAQLAVTYLPSLSCTGY